MPRVSTTASATAQHMNSTTAETETLHRVQISRAQAAHTDFHIADATPDTAAPTFFDGTYFSSSPDGTVTHNDAGDRPHLTEYSVPKWRYLYNTTMVILDLLMTIIATCIVFACNPGAYANVQNMGPSDYGVFSFLSLACISWLISLYAARSYERHTMGEGYGLYAKLLNAAFIDFIMLCTLGYLFHLNVPRSLNVFIPILSLILVIVERWLMRRALHRNRAKGEFNYPTIIIGSPEGISKTLKQLKACLSLGYAPIAVCPVASVCDSDDPNAAQHLVSVPFIPANDEEARLKVLALNSHLPQTAKRMKVRTILIADVLTRDSETMRTLSLAVESMGIELVSGSYLTGQSLGRNKIPVLVGEWCVENQWALHSQNRSAAYRQVSRLQRAAWDVSAGQIYWSYQLARSAKPGSGEGKPPRDPRNGGNLEAWDLTRVWRHGWIRADTSHDDMP